VYLSRGIAESFAIVQVGQTAGVPVYLESQLVARTRADGSALVNNLRAYQDNRVSVDPLAVPLDSSMGAMSQTVRPRWLGGVALDFAVRPAVGMTLTLLQVDGTLMPPWTAVDVLPKANAPEDASRFVVGRRGEVFVEFAQPGSYSLRATPPGGTPCYVELQAVAHTQSPLPLQCK
jgi:outer membrane usher protein